MEEDEETQIHKRFHHQSCHATFDQKFNLIIHSRLKIEGSLKI